MSAVPTAAVTADGFSSDEQRRKRLGQYFTGVRLARLLAALAGTQHADSVIDPMIGSGDMIAGALAHGRPSTIGGIELDPVAFASCAARLTGIGSAAPSLVLGSAFAPAVLAQLPMRQWDIVITNPPYVRYQSTSRGAGTDIRIPSGLETRSDLVAALDHLDALDAEDRRLFREIAQGYSGLADLAVPAWILCAGLVKVGGTLAMLVPTTWLSRDYAHPIRYLLHRWFDIRCVVEDGDASWFDEALVRTTLVVATRVPRRDSWLAHDGADGHVHYAIDASTADERSLVGGLFPDAADPEVEFAQQLAAWKSTGATAIAQEPRARWVAVHDDAEALRQAAASEPWLARVEPTIHIHAAAGRTSVAVPSELAHFRELPAAKFCLLDDLGWRAGQGLRTGANKFFYLRAMDEQALAADVAAPAPRGQLAFTALAVPLAARDDRGAAELLMPARELATSPVPVPTHATVVVLQRQADLPATHAIHTPDLRGRVLDLRALALPEDLDGLEGAPYATMPPALADHVRHAASVNVGTDTDPRFIPQLSAVAPNARPSESRDLRRAARFWYQLPPFTDRHRPALLLARINNTHPRAYLNIARAAVVDANFSTLWPTEGATVKADAMLAMLNSAWCRAALELSCTVMGGGALKVEAAHMRRLAIPRLTEPAWNELTVLGRRLASTECAAASGVLDAIDHVILAAMGAPDPSAYARELIRIARGRLDARS